VDFMFVMSPWKPRIRTLRLTPSPLLTHPVMQTIVRFPLSLKPAIYLEALGQ
jgi:hypothetical protein